MFPLTQSQILALVDEHKRKMELPAQAYQHLRVVGRHRAKLSLPNWLLFKAHDRSREIDS